MQVRLKMKRFKLLTGLMSTLLLIVSTNTAANSSVQTLLIENQEKQLLPYPYNHLVNRTNSIKIFFSNGAINTNCTVTMKMRNKTWKVISIISNVDQFKVSPLITCLPLEKATQALASTYAY